MNQCLSYPTKSTFNRITGLCHRLLSKEDALLPNDPRLDIISGIDLTKSVEAVIEQLRSKVAEVEKVGIVFFCGKLHHRFHPNQ